MATMHACRWAAVLAAVAVHSVIAHPLCLDGTSPSQANASQAAFCSEALSTYDKVSLGRYGGCCTSAQETSAKATLYDPYTLSPECQPFRAALR
jgi:hypothetical protein